MHFYYHSFKRSAKLRKECNSVCLHSGPGKKVLTPISVIARVLSSRLYLDISKREQISLPIPVRVGLPGTAQGPAA